MYSIARLFFGKQKLIMSLVVAAATTVVAGVRDCGPLPR